VRLQGAALQSTVHMHLDIRRGCKRDHVVLQPVLAAVPVVHARAEIVLFGVRSRHLRLPGHPARLRQGGVRMRRRFGVVELPQ